MTTVVVALLALAALRWADIRAARRGAAGLLFALLLPTSIGNPASALNVESTSRSSVFAAVPHSCVYTYDAEFFILQGPQLGSAVQALVASLSGGDQRRSAPRPCPSSLAPRYNNRSIPTTRSNFVATKPGVGAVDDARFVVDSAGNTTLRVRGPGGWVEVSEHAAEGMTQRGISIGALDDALAQQPFQYWHEGVWKTGYYNPTTKVFAGTVNGQVTTVIKTGPNYVNNLKAATPP
jgi:hypothetical protein